jgi:hypothetical protein
MVLIQYTCSNINDLTVVFIIQSFMRERTYRKCIQRFVCKYPQERVPAKFRIVIGMSDYLWGFGLEIGFIDHFNT